MEIAINILNWIYANFWPLFVMTFVMLNVRGVNHALKGGNGKWQTNEVATFVVLILTVWVFWKDGVREHEWEHFPTWEKLFLLITLIVIAKLEKVVPLFINAVNAIKGFIRKDGEN